ncbi:MAG TPA: sensor histidine kinase [Actinomycetota bacterium]|nr:sensor histidine kinase [Actinomycetota bacterium]
MDRPTLWTRIRGVNPLIWDGLLAAAILVIGLVVAASTEHRLNAEELFLITAGTAPLAVRRRAPSVVLAVVAAATALYATLGNPDELAGQLAIATYTVAAYEERQRVAWFGAPVAIAAGVVAGAAAPPPANWVEVLVALTLGVGIPLVLGRVMFNRRRRIVDERERAARDAVTQERARIARELHDVVAHAMTVMVVQAGAARTVIDRDPGEASAAIRRVEETGRVGLAEMRRLIGVLQDTPTDAALAPQPGLDGLDALLDTIRAAGVPVEAMTEGTPRDLPPGVDLTAYRVIQEALTNVLRHAGPAAHTSVTLRYAPDGVEVRVADDGRGPVAAIDGRGHGLVGMRERVTLFEGTLETGPRPGGGFEVRAWLPVVQVPA